VNHAARRRERPRELAASELDFYSLTGFSACHELQGNGLWTWNPLNIGIGLIGINERIQLGYGLLKRHQRCSCGGDQGTGNGDPCARGDPIAFQSLDQTEQMRALQAAVINESGIGRIRHEDDTRADPVSLQSPVDHTAREVRGQDVQLP
jgi:hypothetical protein